MTSSPESTVQTAAIAKAMGGIIDDLGLEMPRGYEVLYRGARSMLGSTYQTATVTIQRQSVSPKLLSQLEELADLL